MIGQKVCKKSGKNNTLQPKPFKSGKKFNTIKEIVVHPIKGTPAYTFIENDSIVEYSHCVESPELDSMCP